MYKAHYFIASNQLRAKNNPTVTPFFDFYASRKLRNELKKYINLKLKLSINLFYIWSDIN